MAKSIEELYDQDIQRISSQIKKTEELLVRLHEELETQKSNLVIISCH